jgi:hypothetical protein
VKTDGSSHLIRHPVRYLELTGIQSSQRVRLRTHPETSPGPQIAV